MNTDKAWEKWGKEDPYFGVLSDEKFRGDAITSDAITDFFKSGEEHISYVMSVIQQHFPGYVPQKAIDFGCGTGRLVLPLAKICTHVTGIDVSDSMLDEARKNVEKNNFQNVAFIKSDDTLSLLQGEYNFIHSYIVFQHIPTERGEKIISNLLTHLSKDGVAVLHLTYGKRSKMFRRVLDTLRYNVPFFQNLINMIRGRKISEPPMQMNSYNLNRILDIFQRNAVGKIFIEFTAHSHYLGVILYCQKN
jgi:ubiquinone/menaquinone biosynthesis C-methylase UbiE